MQGRELIWRLNIVHVQSRFKNENQTIKETGTAEIVAYTIKGSILKRINDHPL